MDTPSKEKKQKAILIALEDEEHRRIKMSATALNKSIKSLVLDAIEFYLNKKGNTNEKT